MSTASTASDHTAPLLGGTNHFLLRRLHSLTGLIFGGYLVVHLTVNATIAELGTVYQVQVDKIHQLPLLWGIEWVFIFLPIIFHTVYGIWITMTGQWNAGAYGYKKNIFYVLQRISAAIIVLFMLFHILALKYGLFGTSLAFDPHAAARTVHQHMLVSPIIPWVIYPLGILASCYHLANGIWTAGITWGLTVSAGAQRRWGYFSVLVFIFTLAAGMTADIAATVLQPAGPNAPSANLVQGASHE